MLRLARGPGVGCNLFSTDVKIQSQADSAFHSITGVPQSHFVPRQGFHRQISGEAGIHAYLSGQQLFACGAKGGNDALLVS